MAFKVEVAVDESFDTDCPIDTVFAILEDVPYSVSHFPKVDQLVDEGGGVYRWEMAKIGIQSYHIQTIYACKYVSDEAKHTVVWTPVKGVGNAVVSGKWTLKELKDGGTRLKLSTKGELEVPFPSLTKMLLSGFVRAEFEGMIATYIKNLTATFAKGKKPPAKKAAAKKKPAAKK